MNVDDLVRDIRKVRERGLGLNVAGVPALKEAMERHWPGDPAVEHRLEALIIEAAAALDDHAAQGIRLALGVGYVGKTSKDRREDFAAHYDRTSETVRKPRSGRPSLEEEAFTALARAILSLPGVSKKQVHHVAVPPAGSRQVTAPTNNVVGGPEAVLRAHGIEAQKRGQWEEAATWAVLLLAAIERDDHANPVDNEAKLAEQYLQTGLSCLVAGRLAEAQDHLRQCERSSQVLLDLNADDADSEARLALTLLLMSSVHLQTGDEERSNALAVRSSELLQRAADRGPRDAEMRSLLIAIGLLQSGALHATESNAVQAEGFISRAVSLLEQLVDEDPDDPDYQGLLASGLVLLGSLRVHADREPEAEKILVRAIELIDPLVRQPIEGAAMPIMVAFAPMVEAQAQFYLGMVYGITERFEAAEIAWTRSVDLLGKQAGADIGPPAPAMFSMGVSTLYPLALAMLGFLYVETGRGHEAAEVLERAAEQFDGDDVDSWSMLADVLEALAAIYQDAGRAEQAEEVRLREHTIRLRISEQDPGGA